LRISFSSYEDLNGVCNKQKITNQNWSEKQAASIARMEVFVLKYNLNGGYRNELLAIHN